MPLLRHPAVKALRSGRTRTTRVVQHLLRHCRFAAGARAMSRSACGAIGERWVQTIKGPSGIRCRGRPPCARANTSGRCRAPRWISRDSPTTPWRKLIAKATKARRAPSRASRPISSGERFRSRFPTARAPSSASISARFARYATAGRVACRSPRSRSSSNRAPPRICSTRASRLADGSSGRGDDRQQGGARLRAGAWRADVIGAPVHARKRRAGRRCDHRRRACARWRANACSRSPPTRPDSSPTTTPSGCTRCESARGACARACALVAPHAPSAALDRLTGDVKWLARRAGRGARLGRVRARDAAAARQVVRARCARPRPGSGDCARAPSRGAAAARAAARDAVASPRFQRMLLSGGHAVRDAALRDVAAGGGSAGAATRSAAAPPRSPPTLLARRHRQLDAVRGRARIRVAGGAPRSAHRREAAPLHRGVLRAALSAQARQGLSQGADRAAGRARPPQRRVDRRCASRTSRAATAADAATGAVRGWVAAQAAALEPDVASAWRRFAAREAVLDPQQEGRGPMLESAEIGHRIAKADYAREEPKLREALLNAQWDLSQSGRGPVLLDHLGCGGRRPRRDREQADRVDGPAAHSRRRVRSAHRRRRDAPAAVALLARAAADGPGRHLHERLVQRDRSSRSSAATIDDAAAATAPRVDPASRADAGRRGARAAEVLDPPVEEGPEEAARDAGAAIRARAGASRARDWAAWRLYSKSHDLWEHVLRETSTGEAPWYVVEGHRRPLSAT